MTDFASRALLPAGFADLLPPEAGFEAATVERLMSAFAAQGYVRVKPPLLEFEESLLGGSGAAMARHSFRLMDPVSQRMLALRPDMVCEDMPYFDGPGTAAAPLGPETSDSSLCMPEVGAGCRCSDLRGV